MVGRPGHDSGEGAQDFRGPGRLARRIASTSTSVCFRQVWGALAAPRPRGKEHLVYKKQIAPALTWLRTLAEKNTNNLTRIIHAADRNLDGPTIVTDASPWGGGAL